jgi:tRNA-modifying protein YgfZ
MSSKLETALDASALPAARSVLPGGVIEFDGRDAAAFAQAQLMNDVRGLADGQWQWTGWLTPKGRVIALGALLRHAADRYWLLLPDASASTLVDQLRRFVFRSKLTISVRDDIHAAGLWLDPAALGSSARHAAFTCIDRVTTLDFSGERARSLLLGEGSALEPLLQAHHAELAGADAWAVEDLAHGLPRIDPHAGAMHTPQMLALDRLGAYSVRKGCYPGQEIVARTHFLGQSKRALRRTRSPVALRSGDELRAGDVPVCEVLCAAADGARHEALVVLPLERVDSTLHCPATGADASIIDFASGLAR